MAPAIRIVALGLSAFGRLCLAVSLLGIIAPCGQIIPTLQVL